MSVNAKLVADFSSFDQAVERSAFRLRDFALEPGKVERALSRMVDDFSGAKLVTQALLAADAVEHIGGASRLTDAELQRVAKQAHEAATKLRLMGEDVPEKLTNLARHLEPVPEQLTLTQRAGALLSSTFAQMTASLTFVSLLNRGVSALYQWGAQAIEAAGHTVDLANKLGFSTETIQRMAHVADQTGTSVDALGNAAFRLQTKWESQRKSVSDLGLSWQQLSALSPEAKFAAVVDALGKVSDVEERNRIGFAIFGKQFGEIAPAVAEGYSRLAASAKTAGDAQVRALDNAVDRWGKFKRDVGTAIVQALGDSLLYFDSMKDRMERQREDLMRLQGVWGEFAKVGRLTDIQLPGASPEVVKGLTDYVAQLREARAETATLTAEQTRQIHAAQELGVSTKDLAEEYGVSELAIKRLSEATKLQADLMGRDTVEKATALLGALQALEAQGLRPQQAAWEGIVSTMTAAQGVMRDTGQAGMKMYMDLEAARRQYAGLTKEGLIPSMSPFQDQFTLPDTMPQLKQWVDEYIQSTEAAIDAEARFRAELAESQKQQQDGIVIIGGVEEAHRQAGDAGVDGAARAAAGYGVLKQSAEAAGAAVRAIVPPDFSWEKAYREAGLFVADSGAFLRPTDRSGWYSAFGGQMPSSTTIHVDARESIFDGTSATALADKISGALISSLRARGLAVGA